MTQYDMFIETLKNKNIEFTVEYDGPNDPLESGIKIVRVLHTVLPSIRFVFSMTTGKMVKDIYDMYGNYLLPV
jgi:hypothetical protein